MSEALRKACEAWLIGLVRANGIYVDTAHPVPEIAIPLLVAFAKQQRAEVWREAAKLVVDGVVDVSYECGPNNWKTFKSSDPKAMARACEQQARELES